VKVDAEPVRSLQAPQREVVRAGRDLARFVEEHALHIFLHVPAILSGQQVRVAIAEPVRPVAAKELGPSELRQQKKRHDVAAGRARGPHARGEIEDDVAVDDRHEPLREPVGLAEGVRGVVARAVIVHHALEDEPAPAVTG